MLLFLMYLIVCSYVHLSYEDQLIKLLTYLVTPSMSSSMHAVIAVHLKL